jgi:hypothetical protein
MKNKSSECKCGKGAGCCKNKTQPKLEMPFNTDDPNHNVRQAGEHLFSKTPTVYEKHVIVIDGVEHLVKGMEWTDSIREAISDGWLENSPEEIVEYITNQEE